MAINKILLTNISDTLQGTFQFPFELTDYTDSSTIVLASGRTEEIGGYLYRVEGGGQSITDSGVSNGTVYAYVQDTGSGSATASVSATVPTYDETKGGWYNGTSKAVCKMIKSTGPVYSNKTMLSKPYNQQVRSSDLYSDNADLYFTNVQNLNIHPDSGSAVATPYKDSSGNTIYCKKITGTSNATPSASSDTTVYQFYCIGTVQSISSVTYIHRTISFVQLSRLIEVPRMENSAYYQVNVELDTGTNTAYIQPFFYATAASSGTPIISKNYTTYIYYS